MRTRVGVALSAGFGSLLILIALLGFGALHRTTEIQSQMRDARVAFEEADSTLRELPSEVHYIGILVRDYAIDPSPSAAFEYKSELTRQKRAIENRIQKIGRLRSVNSPKVDALRAAVQEYIESLDPMLAWSPEEKLARSYWFIRQNLTPMRHTIVNLAAEAAAINSQFLAAAHAARLQSENGLRDDVTKLTWLCLSLGAIIAVFSMWRVVSLERQTDAARVRAEEAESEERRLAMRIVGAQEEERKRISLELHDAVGQMASALGLELANLDVAKQSSDGEFQSKLAELKQLNTDVVRAIKELAGGLRPAMLDDLGLASALRWHTREVARRSGMPVDLRLDGEVESVPEPQKTCIYRIVQEALNNCTRHAKATRAVVHLQGEDGLVKLTVKDDGVGFDTGERRRPGLGILGIRERARELNGKTNLVSRPGYGTLLEIELPIRTAEGIHA